MNTDADQKSGKHFAQHDAKWRSKGDETQKSYDADLKLEVNYPKQWISNLTSGGGIDLGCANVWLFNVVGKGTLAPWNPPEQLIVVGPYRYCRNPMTTCILAILLGEGLLLHSANLLFWARLVFGINRLFYMV